MNLHRNLSLLLMTAAVVLASFTGATAAQDAGTAEASSSIPKFTIKPVGDHPEGYFADVPANPGDVITLEVAVTNIGTVPADLVTFNVNANSAVNGGFVTGTQTDEPTGSNAWVEYPLQEFVLQPGEQAVFPVVITVPTDALPGQYISGIMAQTRETVAVEGTSTIDQRIGAALTVGLLLPGDLTHAFELGEPVTESRESTIDLWIPIANTGNYLVRPEGSLSLVDGEGTEILAAPIVLKSIYAGNATSIQVSLPPQTPPGGYTLSLTLTDPASGVSASIDAAVVTVTEPAEPSAVTVVSAFVEPNAEDIAFTNVNVVLSNSGQQIAPADVILNVFHDGEAVESFSLANNQVLVAGENTISSIYAPAEGWQPGTYTFSLTVLSVDPIGGQQATILEQDLDAEVIVP